MSFVWIFLFLSSWHSAVAFQDTTAEKKYYPLVSLTVQKGFIIPHSRSIRDVSYSKPWVFEIDYSRHYTSEKAWDYCSCYPRLGISASYINFNNPHILGSAFTLAPYVEPFLSAQKKISLSFRFTAGFAYLTTIYDPVKNPQNLFFGTHISYILGIKIAFNYRLPYNWNLDAGINYNHISNGGNRKPNKGINFPTFSLGIGKYLQPVRFNYRNKSSSALHSRHPSLRLAIFGTAKKPFTEKSNRYLLYGTSLNWNYPVGSKSDLTVGAEFVNDMSLKEYLKETQNIAPDHKKAGLLAGHVLVIGRFSFSQQLGVYLYSPAKNRDPVYQRWGLEYRINKKMYARINLKAHRQEADFMDFGVGLIW